MEDRLGLVVARVADRHGRRASGLSHLAKPLIARASRFGLESRRAGWLPVTKIERETKRLGKRGHELGVVPGRLLPDTVVQVRDGEPKPKRLADLPQQSDECNTVAAARNGHDPGRSPARVAPPAQEPLDLSLLGRTHRVRPSPCAIAAIGVYGPRGVGSA